MSGSITASNQTEFDDTMEALRRAENALPDFSSSYDGEIRKLYEQIVNRPAFRYDPGSDALYQSYRTQAVTEGARAMRDTMGQAAALTGGYASSYAQSVGQQQYGAYLERLSQMMPELYKAAYEQYSAEGDALKDQFDMTKGLADSESSRKRDRFNQAVQLEQRQYERGEKSYQKLVSLISQSGYQPSDAELHAAGMTRTQAEALRSDYLQKNPLALVLSGGWPLSSGSGGGGGGSAYSAGSASASSAETGAKEQRKLAANQAGSNTAGKKRRT